MQPFTALFHNQGEPWTEITEIPKKKKNKSNFGLFKIETVARQYLLYAWCLTKAVQARIYDLFFFVWLDG